MCLAQLPWLAEKLGERVYLVYRLRELIFNLTENVQEFMVVW